MKKKINCFIPFGTPEDTMQTVKELQVSELVNKIYLLGSEPGKKALPGCEYLSVKGFYSTDTMKTIAANANTEYTLFYLKQTPLKLGDDAAPFDHEFRDRLFFELGNAP